MAEQPPDSSHIHALLRQLAHARHELAEGRTGPGMRALYDAADVIEQLAMIREHYAEAPVIPRSPPREPNSKMLLAVGGAVDMEMLKDGVWRYYTAIWQAMYDAAVEIEQTDKPDISKKSEPAGTLNPAGHE